MTREAHIVSGIDVALHMSSSKSNFPRRIVRAGRLISRRPAVRRPHQRDRGECTVAIRCSPHLSTEVAGDSNNDNANSSAKEKILEVVNSMRSRRATDSQVRGEVEELMINLERQSVGVITPAKLEGNWKLMYTTARDVTVLFQFEEILSASLKPFTETLSSALKRLNISETDNLSSSQSSPVLIGDIYQCFSSNAVQNVINFSLPSIISGKLIVNALYNVTRDRVISIQFKDVSIDRLELSELSEAIIAPAVLPRNNNVTMRVLQSIAELTISVPLPQISNSRDLTDGRWKVIRISLCLYSLSVFTL